MRNRLLIVMVLAVMRGGLLGGPIGVSAALADPAPANPVASAPASATTSYSFSEGKLVRITRTPAQTIDGVFHQESGSMEILPGAVVTSRVVSADGRKYRVDQAPAQVIGKEAVPAVEVVTELPPDAPCPEVPGPGVAAAWFIMDQGPPLPDVVVDGVKLTGRTQNQWHCEHALGVVGGVAVRDSEATPWQAEIYSDAKYTRQDLIADARLVRARSGGAEFLNQRHAYEFHHHCGAVLISENWVLTAQHCITDGDGRINPEYFRKWRRIRVGTHDLVHGGITLAIQRVVMHPHFDGSRYRNDIALIEIAPDAQTDPSSDNGFVAPIRILGTHDDDPKQPGAFKTFTVYGWGTQSQRSAGDPDHRDDHGRLIHEARGLRRVNLDYVPRGQCARHAAYRGDITPGVICAGYAPGGRDSCQGDSGGPLVATVPDKSKLLVGIVSGGMGCALRDTPGIYTYVPYYLPWIIGVVGAGALSH